MIKWGIICGEWDNHPLEVVHIRETFVLNTIGNIYITGSFDGPAMYSGGITLNSCRGGTSPWSDVFILKFCKVPSAVWPGDTNGDHIADNSDLFKIGLFYGWTGPARTVPGNVWQADSAADWSATISGLNLKHADCNGDGVINANDTLAINLNYSLTHAITADPVIPERSAPEIYFVTSNSYYTAGQMVDAEIWLGTPTDSVSNLYGISFNIKYDSWLVEPGTETITYPSSWLGTPGSDALTIFKMDPAISTAHAGIVRTNQTDKSGYGKIADFKFQVKSNLPADDSINIAISGFETVSYSNGGNPIPFNVKPHAIAVTSSVGLENHEHSTDYLIYPNPFSDQLTIKYDVKERAFVCIEIFDVFGKKINTVFSSEQVKGNYSSIIDTKLLSEGCYLVKMNVGDKRSTHKLFLIR
jgi:hypothetical protein